MAKITLASIASGFNLSKIAQNFQAIQDALNNNVLWRHNPTGEANQMINSNLDMNGNQILNLPAPINSTAAARLQDVTDAIAGAKTAALTSFVPYGNLTQNNVQGALQQEDDLVTGLRTDLNPLIKKSITPYQFGAVGGGVADDTVAVVNTFNYANLHPEITEVDLSGIFLCDFLNASLNGRFLATLNRDNLSIRNGVIKVAPNSYTNGVGAGQSKIFIMFVIQGNNCIVDNVTFDVNNQGTNYPASSTLPNVEFRHTYLNGSNITLLEGNNITNNKYLNGNGQSYIGNYQRNSIISNNYAQGSIGMGFNASQDSVLSSNTSVDARDAHFGIWLSTRITAVGNIGYGNDNGGGLDVSGSSDVIVLGNILKNNSNYGIWVGRDPNIGTVSQGVLVDSNTCVSNQNYIFSGSSEIMVGNQPYDSSGAQAAAEVTITGNRCIGATRAIFIGDASTNVRVYSNTLEPTTPNTPFPNNRIYIDTTGPVIINDNVTTSALADWSDIIVPSNATLSYTDIKKRNFIQIPNGPVIAGSQGQFNDLITLSSTARLIGEINLLNTTAYQTVKVKVAIAADDRVNYQEKEMIFYGSAGTIPTQDATTRTFAGTSAVSGWTFDIEPVLDTNGVIKLYATLIGGSSIAASIDFEVYGKEDIQFVKVYNL